jgi:LAO/AO transport system kinase
MVALELASRIRSGDRRALAKGISLAENDVRESAALIKRAKPPWRAFVVGVTGPPGTGKSTLVDKLITLYRKKGLKVGVIAVDPTSPFTGGALLGDRVRMKAHATDKNVFIRSMASRGWTGGLSRSTSQTIQLLDAAGFDIIIIETVGIGQADIEVVRISHAVLVVLMPGQGDDIQMSKAGLMEVGDIYVVNKSDLEGADSMVTSILAMLRGVRSRSPIVVKVSALYGEGLDKVVAAIESLRSKFNDGASDLRLRSIKGMVVETARGDLMWKFGRVSESQAEKLAGLVLKGKLSVDEAAARLARA